MVVTLRGPGRLRGGTCKEALSRTSQVQRGLGDEKSRVQRFFISTTGAPDAAFLAADHPGLLVLPDKLTSRDAVLATLGEFAEGDVFIADPLGNVVLRFPAGTAMKDMDRRKIPDSFLFECDGKLIAI